MSQYLEYALDDGGTLLVEVSGAQLDGPVKAGVGDSVARIAAKVSFSDALGSVRHSAKELLAALSEFAADELEVKFGIKAAGEAGGVFALAKASGEFTYEVTLKWTRSSDT